MPIYRSGLVQPHSLALPCKPLGSSSACTQDTRSRVAELRGPCAAGGGLPSMHSEAYGRHSLDSEPRPYKQWTSFSSHTSPHMQPHQHGVSLPNHKVGVRPARQSHSLHCTARGQS